MMTSRRLFVGSVLTLAAVPFLSNAQTCCAAKAAKKEGCAAGAAKLAATGATVLETNAQKTKIKVTCAKCGKVVELEIDTPTADKPYAQEWACPKCGNKQKVTVEAAKA
jgi:DNA-directed RNA polymerase subunit M/transcription elongation factor TFIIS